MQVTLSKYMEGGSLWGSIQALEPFPFFDDYTPDKLNTYTEILYGDRIMFSKLINLDIDDVAELIVMSLKDKWEKLISVNSSDLDLLSNESSVKSENNVVKTTDQVTGAKNNLVSAFNSEDMINDSGDTTTENSEKDLTGDKVTKYSKQSLNNLWDNLTLVEKSSIISVITKDVSNQLTLTTY